MHWLNRLFHANTCLALSMLSLSRLSASEIIECEQEMAEIRNIEACLLIGDIDSAVIQASRAFKQFPDSQIVFEEYLKALSAQKDDRPLLEAWEAYHAKYPASVNILEEVAWGVLGSGKTSGSDITRLYALAGGAMCRDIKGVYQLREGMRASSALIRCSAAQLAGRMFDQILKDEIIRLLKEEKVWYVRLEAIRSAGKMKIEASRELIQVILQDTHSTPEEKRAAMTALVEMSEQVCREDLIKLSKSKHVVLRQLSCALIAHYEKVEDADVLFTLAQDGQADVRRNALLAAGRLIDLPISKDALKACIEKALEGPDREMSITASWLAAIAHVEDVDSDLEKWLKNDSPYIRRTAAGAIASAGSAGISCARKYFDNHPDPYVRLNLSLALLQQRVEVQNASREIKQVMDREKERWSRCESGGFKFIGPSTCRHIAEMPGYPDTVDSLTRLEMLNLLAIVGSSEVDDAVKVFLQEKAWGISGTAALTLLAEGNEQALESIKKLLVSDLPQIRLQAALVLALWGKDEGALDVLEGVYRDADRQMKEQVLQGVAAVGSERSLPFLTEVLKEPFQTLRILAAAAIIQCMNN